MIELPLHRVAPVMQQVMMQLDLDRTNVGARAAQRAGVRQGRPLGCVAKMRRDDRADRTLIGRAVGVTADILEHRASVEARAATNAVQRVPLLGGSPATCA